MLKIIFFLILLFITLTIVFNPKKLYNLIVEKINKNPFNAILYVYYYLTLFLFIILDFENLNDLFIPELFLFIFLTILLLLLVIFKKSVKNDDDLSRLCEVAHTTTIGIFFIYAISLTAVFIFNILLNLFINFEYPFEYYVIFKFNYYYIFDFYTYLSKIFIVIFFLINLFFIKYNYCFNFYKKLSVEFIPLLGFCVNIGCLAISSNDLFIIFVLFEIISFLLIYLIVINSNTISIESGVKFFFLNSFVGALGFIGILILYLINGFFSTNLDVLASVFKTFMDLDKFFLHDNGLYLKIACFLIFINFFFKFGIFPVHIFIVDVYLALPMISIFFISTTLKLVYLFIFIKVIFYCFGSFIHMFSPFMVFIAVITYAIGAYGAYNETNIKKFLAYSSISHSGFMLLGLGGNDIAYNMAFSLFYFIVYLLGTILLFAVILSHIDLKNKGELFNSFNDFYLINYSVSSKRFYSIKNTILNKFFITVAVLVFIGLPPLSGFIAKYAIFLNLFKANYHFLSFIILLFSVLSGIYYFTLLISVWYNKEDVKNFSDKLISTEIFESPNSSFIKIISFFVILLLFFGAFLLPIDFNVILKYIIKFIKSSNPWL